MSSALQSLAPAFQDSLCPGDIGFTPDGYLSQCTVNTYLFTPISLILAIWAIAETKNLNTNGHTANSLSSRVNFALTSLYTVIIFQNGPNVFNFIAIFASFFSLLVVFILSFLDLKGVNVSRKPLEIYFFLVAAVSGYFVVQHIGLKHWGAELASAVYVCLISSVAGSARNITSAFDDAQVLARKPKAN